MTAIGILIMAYGGPDSLDDVEPYLLDVRGGRTTSSELVEEIRERYAAIGGRSPLLEITRRQAQAVSAELNRRMGASGTYRAYVGMRHWAPRIRQAVEEMQADGIEKAVALVMAPHYSRMSIAVYLERLNEALAETEASIEILPVYGWHNHSGLIDAIAEKTKLALQNFSGTQPYIVFTAHSLPSRILAQGDPYADQLQETAHLLAQTLALSDGRWRFSFQSAGRTGEPWLGPQIEEVVPELARAGEKDILIVPVGFVADHVEVLYDIDIEARALAQSHGARLERSDSLNDSPTFISALADLVEERLIASGTLRITGGA
jgi:protoporphyrin/coproporphyrin ferrochelatase